MRKPLTTELAVSQSRRRRRSQRDENDAMIQVDANAFGAIASPGAAC